MLDQREFKAINDLLAKYYYHLSFNTLMNDTLVENLDCVIVIMNSKHTIVLTDNSKITIDGVPYKVGYLSNSKSDTLVNELLQVLVAE